MNGQPGRGAGGGSGGAAPGSSGAGPGLNGAREALPSRPPAVAGLFYPAAPGALGTLVDDLVAAAPDAYPAPAPSSLGSASLAGILVPHAGLVYSGIVAAAAWRLLVSAKAGDAGSPRAAGAAGAPRAAGAAGAAGDDSPPEAATPTIVILGTNHGAPWLDGAGAWDRGPWRTPLGDIAIDDELAAAILALGPPYAADADCHLGEHSIEVQLPFIARHVPGARIVAISVGAGTGGRALAAGRRLGELLAARRAAGERIVLAISTDMAHYPRAAVAEAVTDGLLPSIVGLDPEALAEREADVVRRTRGLSCGMCGIQPAVLGLAALRAMGAKPGVALAAATSADAGADPGRTVGYLAVAFPSS